MNNRRAAGRYLRHIFMDDLLQFLAFWSGFFMGMGVGLFISLLFKWSK